MVFDYLKTVAVIIACSVLGFLAGWGLANLLLLVIT
jgi:hypothetical protein